MENIFNLNFLEMTIFELRNALLSLVVGLGNDILAIYVIHDAGRNELFTLLIKLIVFGQKRHFGGI